MKRLGQPPGAEGIPPAALPKPANALHAGSSAACEKRSRVMPRTRCVPRPVVPGLVVEALGHAPVLLLLHAACNYRRTPLPFLAPQTLAVLRTQEQTQ